MDSQPSHRRDSKRKVEAEVQMIWHVKAWIAGNPVLFLVDPGAQVCVLTQTAWDSIPAICRITAARPELTGTRALVGVAH